MVSYGVINYQEPIIKNKLHLLLKRKNARNDAVTTTGLDSGRIYSLTNLCAIYLYRYTNELVFYCSRTKIHPSCDNLVTCFGGKLHWRANATFYFSSQYSNYWWIYRLCVMIKNCMKIKTTLCVPVKNPMQKIVQILLKF